MGAKQRNGQVMAWTVPGTSAKVMQGFIRATVASGSTIYTDEHSGYVGMGEYKHKSVRHSAKQFVDGMASTNGIESFWALLKRGHYGIFHYMSEKHLDRYVGEFANRHNTSKLPTIEFMSDTAKRAVGRHISYKELIGA